MCPAVLFHGAEMLNPVGTLARFAVEVKPGVAHRVTFLDEQVDQHALWDSVFDFALPAPIRRRVPLRCQQYHHRSRDRRWLY